jgi:hypothetical protein
MKIKAVLLLLSLSLAIYCPLFSQTVTNRNNWSPEEIKALQAAGLDPRYCTPAPTNQAVLNLTPPDLKNAIVCMDSFLGSANAMLPADVISMKAQALKFRFMGTDYDYVGNYTVVLNTPRKHKNPYLGFGSPDTAKILILEDFGGGAMPLQNATIWEKKTDFVDAEAEGKEWIYSGTYTIQN